MKTLEEIRAAIKSNKELDEAQSERKSFQKTGAMGYTWLHVKSDVEYYIHATCVRENDLEVMVLYYPRADASLPTTQQRLFMRPLLEFLDGRFVPVVTAKR